MGAAGFQEAILVLGLLLGFVCLLQLEARHVDRFTLDDQLLIDRLDFCRRLVALEGPLCCAAAILFGYIQPVRHNLQASLVSAQPPCCSGYGSARSCVTTAHRCHDYRGHMDCTCRGLQYPFRSTGDGGCQFQVHHGLFHP
ncbi:hypothetical protein D3C81_1711630 [compost metagenome]